MITDNIIEIKGNKNTLTLSGKIKEKSKLDTLKINNQLVRFGDKKNGENEFIASIDITPDLKTVTILARDEYNNQKIVEYALKRTEINPPVITITAPYSSDDGQVYLHSNAPVCTLKEKLPMRVK